MITKQDAISIINSQTNDHKLLIQVIQRYIFDLKNVEVEINPPNSVNNYHLLMMGYEFAKNYYLTNP